MVKPRKILIIGIAGGLAQITARLLLNEKPGDQIIGIDSREIKSVTPLTGLEPIQMKYSRGNFENLFRSHHFDYVIHLGRISHSHLLGDQLSKRLELSVMGTSRILELCTRHNVSKVIILSTFHVYGALSDNPIFLKEDAPLRASIKYPDLRDVVEMDQIAVNFMWKYQNQLSTVVLRPCNIIGNQIQNTMSKYLSMGHTLSPVDFNPFFQFIHEFDMATVIIRSLKEVPTGVYNIASNEYLSLREAIKKVKNKSIPVPISLVKLFNDAFGTKNLSLPPYLFDYLKFSCLLDNSLIKQHLGENFLRFDIDQTLRLIRLK